MLDGSGFRKFASGDVFDFDVEEAEQDSFHLRATRAAFIRHGTAPELRRVDQQVVVVEPGTPDTPFLPPKAGRRIAGHRSDLSHALAVDSDT